jgi:hypothetical protein
MFCCKLTLNWRTVVFFKVRPPVEPVALVQAICRDAAASAHRKQSRSVKRLTPITLVGKATESGLEEVAREVLRPHFHEGATGKKVAFFRYIMSPFPVNRSYFSLPFVPIFGTIQT